ncbi:hypothetical protein RHMOL_Rhmol04G0085200 [Rhododendron molle]|uniref:Uncharacterized protein n=1 Tax=Rhododendron molle TaxID=49168 RepID=A0ACC0NYR9_RHOML|nr:hypothetical protein RHMOL_Rhmol04G0085200 [Rhododendron molle]
MMLHVTNHPSLGNRPQRQHISHRQISLLPAEHKLARVHPFGRDEELLLVLEPERVAERDPGERGSPARVVDDLGDDALEVAVALAVVEAAEPGRALAVMGVGLEYGSGSLALSSDYATHFWSG